MKNRNIQFYRVPMILTGAILLVLVSLANSSPAAGPQTYTGMLTHGEFLKCNGELLNPPAYSVTGTWIVSIDPITADQVIPPPAYLTLIVLRNGTNYLTFPHIDLTPLPLVEEGVYVYSALGGAATATLDTNADPAMFYWDVAFSDGCTIRSYKSLTYVGVASH